MSRPPMRDDQDRSSRRFPRRSRRPYRSRRRRSVPAPASSTSSPSPPEISRSLRFPGDVGACVAGRSVVEAQPSMPSIPARCRIHRRSQCPTKINGRPDRRGVEADPIEPPSVQDVVATQRMRVVVVAANEVVGEARAHQTLDAHGCVRPFSSGLDGGRLAVMPDGESANTAKSHPSPPSGCRSPRGPTGSRRLGLRHEVVPTSPSTTSSPGRRPIVLADVTIELIRPGPPQVRSFAPGPEIESFPPSPTITSTASSPQAIPRRWCPGSWPTCRSASVPRRSPPRTHEQRLRHDPSTSPGMTTACVA